jgi:UDP-N-acetyl-D-mannosaminuronate dehydrogenase
VRCTSCCRKVKFEVYGYDLDKDRMLAVQQAEIPREVDTMHICIPFIGRHKFVNAVTKYVNWYRPGLVIIDSTIMPGTTMAVHDLCSCHVAHSPIRGVHENPERMKWEIKRWRKYVGGANAESAKAARRHLEKLGLKTRVLKSCTETELAKLLETTYRAWLIACFQEMHRISGSLKADFVGVMDFLEDTHRVRLDRPIMVPGVIGGHCLIPNTELLLRCYNSKFLRLILESNKKRKEEIKDENVQREAEEIKKKAKALAKMLKETGY